MTLSPGDTWRCLETVSSVTTGAGHCKPQRVEAGDAAKLNVLQCTGQPPPSPNREEAGPDVSGAEAESPSAKGVSQDKFWSVLTITVPMATVLQPSLSNPRSG